MMFMTASGLAQAPSTAVAFHPASAMAQTMNVRTEVLADLIYAMIDYCADGISTISRVFSLRGTADATPVVGKPAVTEDPFINMPQAAYVSVMMHD